MNDLGIAILNAMRDQGWLVVIMDDTVYAGQPDGAGAHVMPLVLFREQDETRLRIVLLNLVVTGGLQWPWPPDHREGWHGEVPPVGD